MQEYQLANADERRLIGWILAATSAIAVIGMANHPVGLESFKEYGRAFHGAMMVTTIVIFCALSRFATMAGKDRFSIWVGTVCLGLGTTANFIAGSISGFVVPELAQQGLETRFWPLTWALNQTMAYWAIHLTSAAFVIWGIDWAARTTGTARIRGVAAVLIGVIPPLCLALQIIDMDAVGAFVAYSIQTVFSVLAASELLKPSD